jgi:hypothetical protein
VRKKELDKTVCLQFCSYYKPGKKEELSCGGYQVIDRFLEEGRRLRVEVSGSRCSAEDRECIVRAVCSTCSFREDGCDFIVNRTAHPCGGFRMISQLIADGMLRIGEL